MRISAASSRFRPKHVCGLIAAWGATSRCLRRQLSRGLSPGGRHMSHARVPPHLTPSTSGQEQQTSDPLDRLRPTSTLTIYLLPSLGVSEQRSLGLSQWRSNCYITEPTVQVALSPRPTRTYVYIYMYVSKNPFARPPCMCAR